MKAWPVAKTEVDLVQYMWKPADTCDCGREKTIIDDAHLQDQ